MFTLSPVTVFDIRILMQVLETRLRRDHEVRPGHDGGPQAVRPRVPGVGEPGVIPGLRPARRGPGDRRVSSEHWRNEHC